MKFSLRLAKRMAVNLQLSKPKQHILLTGMPGVGKTTLVRKVCEQLEDKNWESQGFYTEELRVDGDRVGFDVVTMDGKRGPLARISRLLLEPVFSNIVYTFRDNPGRGRGYTVGRYNVQLQSFEQLALPSLKVKTEECTRLVVIDEIGKMELFSRGFQQTVKELLKHPKVTMFATIPAPGKANPYVEEIRHRDDVLVYTVTRDNRHHLVEEISSAVVDSLEHYGT